MEKTDGYIETDNQIDYLFTYSEEEKQEIEVSRNNSSLIFSPEFIPFYPKLALFLTTIENILYSFMKFYLQNSSNRLYFTNKQFSEIIVCSEDSISRAIAKLEKLNLIKTSRKVRAGGGQIRFITNIAKYDYIANLPTTKNAKLDSEKCQARLRKNYKQIIIR